ncbi:unnamed protein product [Peronospora belbahrii]|uniref:Calcineurin-like phosphoesterase domain-containing protein n=1 Tax=Peronospora belbahrii TaxID=622444 RepID=A0AAU9KT91_9STRA|nr:unnamed protein product [Peronospora belbahrii]
MVIRYIISLLLVFALRNITSSAFCVETEGINDIVTTTRTLRHIVHFSDVHLNISVSLNDSESAAIPIAYGNDAPISLLISALAYAKNVLPDPDLFLYTGDHVVHGELSEKYLFEAVETNIKTMDKYYSTLDSRHEMLDITAIIGNSDSTPDYTMKVTNPQTEANPTIALISGAWNNTMSRSDLDWFNNRGYLAYAFNDNLTVITLNTLPYSPSHLPDTSKLPDPFDQFAWLNATLCELKSAGKYAYIVGHIPPIIDSYNGSPMWNESYMKTYKQIVGQYSDVVKAQFFGHVHSIEFRLPLSRSLSAKVKREGVIADHDYEDSSELVPLFMVAAISPIYLSNPAFMVWDFDDTTYEILDFTVYGGNISSATGAVDWEPLFNASHTYGVNSLSTLEIARFAERVAVDAELLEQYYFNSKAQSRLQLSCLDVSCQAKWLCSLYWWSTAVDYEDCVSFIMTSNLKSTSTFQLSTSSPTRSLMYTSTIIMVGGMIAAAAFVLLLTIICRRSVDQNDLKLFQRQRVDCTSLV